MELIGDLEKDQNEVKVYNGNLVSDLKMLINSKVLILIRSYNNIACGDIRWICSCKNSIVVIPRFISPCSNRGCSCYCRRIRRIQPESTACDRRRLERRRIRQRRHRSLRHPYCFCVS